MKIFYLASAFLLVLFSGACTDLEPMSRANEFETGKDNYFVSLDEALEIADHHFNAVYGETRSEDKKVKSVEMLFHTLSNYNLIEMVYGYRPDK